LIAIQPSAGKPAPTVHGGPLLQRLADGSNPLIEKKFIRARPAWPWRTCLPGGGQI